MGFAMRRLPPLNPLRAFEATARHMSVSRAAEELNVTHSAISHQLRVLEDSVGVKLFKRTAGRIFLSAEGAALLPAISGAFDRIGAAAASLARPARPGRLTVSCVPGLLSFWLLPMISSFCERHPETSLTLFPNSNMHDPGNPDVDINILYGDGEWPDLTVKLLSPVRLFPVCHPSLMHNKTLRSPKDIFKHTLLHADNGREWKNWLSANKLQLPADVRHHYFEDARVALEAASYGNGIAIGDTMTSRRSLVAGHMLAPFDIEVAAGHSFYIVYRADMKMSSAAQGFVEWLFGQIAL